MRRWQVNYESRMPLSRWVGWRFIEKEGKSGLDRVGNRSAGVVSVEFSLYRFSMWHKIMFRYSSDLS